MSTEPNVGTPAESPLAPVTLRGLCDRAYDKRKNAALEIEALVKTLEDNNEVDRICAIIALLGQDFTTSTHLNHRKGGLIGLAGVAIGLMTVGLVLLCRFCLQFFFLNYGVSNIPSKTYNSTINSTTSTFSVAAVLLLL